MASLKCMWCRRTYESELSDRCPSCRKTEEEAKQTPPPVMLEVLNSRIPKSPYEQLFGSAVGE